MPTKKLTINDIAAASGVSKTTVSRYLNGKFNMMSVQTRERIKSVIDISAYKPSPIAQSLKSRKTMQIGIVISDLSSPFFSSMLKGISRVLGERNYDMLIVDSGENPKHEQKLVDGLIQRGVDGLLINTSTYENPFLINIANDGTPIVLCDRYVKDYNFDIVTNETQAPFESILRHARNEGFSVPYLFIEEYRHNSTRYLRRRSFIKYSSEYYPNASARENVICIDPDNPEETEAHIRRIIAQNNEPTPPVIIGGNTVTTMHILGVVKSCGLTMPHEIGVCGADDWSWERRMDWAVLIDPGITAFAINAVGLGVEAAQLLMNRIDHPESEKQRILLPVRFVVRGSTRLKKT